MHLPPQFFLTFIRRPANKIWSIFWEAAGVPRHRAHLPDPGGHGVRAGGAVVGVDDDDGDDDRGDDEHHGEQHVLANQRHCAGGGGNQLHDDQQEHSQRQQDGDAEGHFLTCHKKAPQNHCCSYHSAQRAFLWEVGCGWELFSQTPVCICSAIVSASLQSRSRPGKPESLTASAPTLRWELPGMTGLRWGCCIFLLSKSISWALLFEQCSICTLVLAPQFPEGLLPLLSVSGLKEQTKNHIWHQVSCYVRSCTWRVSKMHYKTSFTHFLKSSSTL